MDSVLENSYARVQSSAKRITEEVLAGLRKGMDIQEIRSLCAQLARASGTPLHAPARVGVGLAGARGSLLRPSTATLSEPDLVTLDLHPTVDSIVGDYARTLIFGDNGRMWFYRRIALEIHEAISNQLAACRTTREAYELAWEVAHKQGCRLANRRGTIGHPLSPPGRLDQMIPGLQARHVVSHSLRDRVPFGLASPKLEGLWSIEPLIEVDRHYFLFEDAFLFEGGKTTRLEEPGSGAPAEDSVMEA